MRCSSTSRARSRWREFAPVVIEELTANGQGFTFEEYVIHLSSFMENGSREIINQLHTANRLIPELLNVYAVEDPEQGKFFARNTVNTDYDTNGREHLCTMDPYDFERLIADYFVRRGFVHAEVIGRSGDRGVDVLATNIRGDTGHSTGRFLQIRICGNRSKRDPGENQ